MNSSRIISWEFFFATHHGLLLTAIWLACVVMMLLLIRVLMNTKVSAAKNAIHDDDLIRLNEMVSVIQSRIVTSHRKLSVLCTTIVRDCADDRDKRLEDADFRERLVNKP